MRWPQIPLFPTNMVSPGSSMFAIAASIPAGLPTQSAVLVGRERDRQRCLLHLCLAQDTACAELYQACAYCSVSFAWACYTGLLGAKCLRLPACPVPLMRQTYFDSVWNMYRRPSWISSMIARKGGCRWPAEVRCCIMRECCTAFIWCCDVALRQDNKR